MSNIEQFTLFYGGPFSNWYKKSFVNKAGIRFFHNEQYMMWRKSKLFNDEETASLILQEKDQYKCKMLGRKVKGFDKKIWNANNMQIVYEGAFLKFSQNPDICNKLLSTSGTTLVESTENDLIWGSGINQDHPDAKDRSKWTGENRLGRTLDRVRNDLPEYLWRNIL